MDITSTSLINNEGTLYQNNSSRNITNELGKDEFLNLLVTQLKNQDPLNPVEDKEFIAQMAQFSTLEQILNLNNNISKIKAFSLVGKEVAAEVIDDNTGYTNTIIGKAEGAILDGTEINIIVNNQKIPIDKIKYVGI